MYRTVLSNIVKGMLPPRFHFNGFFNELSLRNIHAAFAEYRESAEIKFRDPVKKIMRRAVRDYCLRRSAIDLSHSGPVGSRTDNDLCAMKILFVSSAFFRNI